MKILFFIARLNKGGTSTFVINASRTLIQMGFEVRIATGNVNSNEEEIESFEGVPVTKLPSLSRKINPFRDLLSFIEFRKILKGTTPDIIVSNTFKAGLISRLVITSIPRVHIYHGHLFKDTSFSIFARLLVFLAEFFLSRISTLNLAVGENVRSELIAMRVVPKHKIKAIVPPVILAEINESSKSFGKLGILESPRVRVAWLGRLEIVKNPRLIIETARKLPHCDFLVCGKGSLEIQLKSLASENVIFLGWVNIQDLFAISHIVVNTSISEGMPLSLIEAQMAGIPVIAPNVGSVSETLIDGKTGFIYNHDDLELIQLINRLANDSALRSKFSDESRKFSQSRFSAEKVVRDLALVLANVIKSSS